MTVEKKNQKHMKAPAKTYSAALVDAITRDVMNIASIYPTAFDLYDEPLDRLAHRIAETVTRMMKL